MNVVVIGLGSMGKRRLRLLKENFPDIQISGVDVKQERRDFCRDEYGVSAFECLERAVTLEKFDCAFICTSPLSHNAIINQCLNNGIHVFSEINLIADGYDENIRLAAEKKLHLFLSSTMMYRDEIRYLCHTMKENQVPVCYNYHVGQYLPDWHPWEDFKDFFAYSKKTNGCREILAIELPWIVQIFGAVQDVKVIRNRLTRLGLDYDDCYMILLLHRNGNTGMIMVDVVAREPVRDLKVVGEQVFISWQGMPECFFMKNLTSGKMERVNLYQEIQRDSNYNKTIVENQYINEIEQFFEELRGKVEPVYGFKEDLEILKLIDRIEKE